MSTKRPARNLKKTKNRACKPAKTVVFLVGCLRKLHIRVWRSLVSRLNGVQEASSSNLDTRTKGSAFRDESASFFIPDLAFLLFFDIISLKDKSGFEEVVKMKDGKHPNPNTIHPIAGYDKEIYVKPTITNPNIIVGDFTYIADSDFESHVSHLYEWNDDKLIIGKFCQIAAGVEFVMNGANHQMNAVSTFPFYTLEGWEMSPPAKTDMPLKGDTVIENDVWIGQNAVILPGVHIGDGAIIGANSVVGSDVPPYMKVIGNPARAIQKRFDDELIELLLRFKWWDRSIDEINRLIPILTCSDLDKVKAEIKKQLG